MDGCEDTGRFVGRLSEEDIGWCAEVASGLLHSRFVRCLCWVMKLTLVDVGEKSKETQELRKKTSMGCEKLIWEYFEQGGQVVIYDANNGTRASRRALAERFDKDGVHVVILGTLNAFISLLDPLCDLVRSSAESLCDNKEIIEANIRSVKISSPDVSFIGSSWVI